MFCLTSPPNTSECSAAQIVYLGGVCFSRLTAAATFSLERAGEGKCLPTLQKSLFLFLMSYMHIPDWLRRDSCNR